MRNLVRLTTLAALSALACAAGPAQAERPKPINWECPDGYQVKEGLNLDFPSAGEKRAFFVHPAKGVRGPAPAWVPLTGSVESTLANLNTARSGANALMADKGFTVIGPVRHCADQDPSLGGGVCNGPGKDGWNWAPWREGRAAGAAGDRWKADPGPDAGFFEAMVKCVGTKFPLDPRRLFIGGISSGGTMTNRALTFRSDFWAGGMPISGEWYVSADDGAPIRQHVQRGDGLAQVDRVVEGEIQRAGSQPDLLGHPGGKIQGPQRIQRLPVSRRPRPAGGQIFRVRRVEQPLARPQRIEAQLLRFARQRQNVFPRAHDPKVGQTKTNLHRQLLPIMPPLLLPSIYHTGLPAWEPASATEGACADGVHFTATGSARG